MIDIVDEKYGRVVIYEEDDHMGVGAYASHSFCGASLVGKRNLKTGSVRILKNRYGSVIESKARKFILDYTGTLDCIYSRWEILDL